MKINLDCLRAVMLEIEKSASIFVNDRYESGFISLSFPAISAALPKYTKEEIVYSLILLDDADFIVLMQGNANNRIVEISVLRMTYQGHEFLNKIQDEKHWGIVKGILASVRDYSLDAITAVSTGVSAAAIEKALAGIGGNFPIISK